MDKNCINHGEHGELVAALLVMQARDALVKDSNQRWVYVCEFLETLLGASVLTATTKPSMAYSGEAERSLTDTFKDARMWFNHVIKIRKSHLINVQHLWKFITRGAMVLCANNQPGVDIILPVCYSGNVLSRRTVTAILIQVKNDTTFGRDIHGYLFDAMDPFKVNLFSKKDKPLPIIRMVFALASKGAVKYVLPPRTTRQSKHPGKYTSYDIRCAKISRKTFPIIRGDEITPYQQLLNRTRFPGQEYAVGKIHEVEYPSDVEEGKIGLLRSFDALVEGGEHRKRKGKSRQKGKKRAGGSTAA